MNRPPQNLRLRCSTIAVAALAALIVGTLTAQAFDEPGREPLPEPFDGFHQLNSYMDQRDWENEHRRIESVIKNFWEGNGWSDEADRFARETACEIAGVPPWQPLQRVRLLNERLEQRYGLTGEKAARMRAAIVREAARFLTRHAGVIFEQAGEGMSAGRQGEPFTAEQVARWAKQGQPLLADLRESADRIAKELQPMLAPAERRILDRDMNRFHERQQVVDRMAARWAQGQWQPAEWGLQDYPIQKVGAPVDPDVRRDGKRTKPSSSSVRVPGKPAPIGRWFPHAPSTWFNYLLDFQKRFSLDAGQMGTAESVHAELLLRANRYIETRAGALKTVPVAKRATHEAYDPLRSLFEEFQSRLDAIPTSSQRDWSKP